MLKNFRIRLLAALGVLVCAVAGATAQAPYGYVTLSATNLQSPTGGLVTNATISFAPVNNSGQAISYRAAAGYGAVLSLSVGSGSLSGCSVTSGGAYYPTHPAVTLSGGGGSGGTVVLTVSAGVITACTASGGSGYSTAPTATVIGYGQSTFIPVTAQVTNGAFTIQLPDTTQTAPVNVCFNASITDNTSGNSLLGPGYNCVQPAGSGTAVTGTQAWCSASSGSVGGTCTFDAYTPNLAALVVTQTGPAGATGATGPAGAAGASGTISTSTATGFTGLMGGNGSTAQNVAIGTTEDASFGPQLESSGGVSTIPGGYECYGDSITASVGATTTANGYCYLINSDINSGTFNDWGNSGDAASDMTFRVLTHAAPTDSGNPVRTTMIGMNDSTLGLTTSPYQTQYYGNQIASSAWLALSSSNKVMAQSALFTQAGTWATDSTFTDAPGEVSTAAASTLTDSACYVGPSGVIYLWYYSYVTGTGTFKFSVDGTALTDTVTGNSTINNQMTGLAPQHAGTTSAQAARYTGIAQGSHTCVITVVSVATGSVGFVGLGFPPAARFRGVTSPAVFMGGVSYKQNTGTATLTQNGWNLAVANLLAGDGLNVRFVNVDAAMDYVLDLAGTALQNCPASTMVGVHPNNCGHRHIANAFEDAMKNPVGVVPSTFSTAITTAIASPASSAGFSNFNGNNLTGPSALIPGINFYESGTNDWGEMLWNGSNLPVPASNVYAPLVFAPSNGPVMRWGGYTAGTLPTAQSSITAAWAEMGGTASQPNFLMLPSAAPNSAQNKNSFTLGVCAGIWTSGAAVGKDCYSIFAKPDAGSNTANDNLVIQQTTKTLTDTAPLVELLNNGGGGVAIGLGTSSSVIDTINGGCTASCTHTLPAVTGTLANAAGPQAFGFATLASGTVTISNSTACTASATCVYKLTNCGLNSTTAVGTLGVGTVSAGTSFVINSYTSTGSVSADVSKVCWQIN